MRIYIHYPNRPSRPRSGWYVSVISMLRCLFRGNDRRQALETLEGLPPEVLRDIGLRVDEVPLLFLEATTANDDDNTVTDSSPDSMAHSVINPGPSRMHSA